MRRNETFSILVMSVGVRITDDDEGGPLWNSRRTGKRNSVDETQRRRDGMERPSGAEGLDVVDRPSCAEGMGEDGLCRRCRVRRTLLQRSRSSTDRSAVRRTGVTTRYRMCRWWWLCLALIAASGRGGGIGCADGLSLAPVYWNSSNPL